MDASAVVTCLSRVAASQRYALSAPLLGTAACTSPHSSLSVEQSPVRLPPLRAEQALAQSKYDRCNCVHECECYWRDLYTDTCPRHRTTTVTLHGSAPMRFCCSAVVNSTSSSATAPLYFVAAWHACRAQRSDTDVAIMRRSQKSSQASQPGSRNWVL